MEEMEAIREMVRMGAKHEMARRSFWEFCNQYDQPFFAKRPFLKSVADGFQQIADGQINTLSVSLPPRAGKSYLTSLFSAWMLGRNPSGSIMRNCCTATLYNKFSYDTREIVRNDKFKAIFPDLILSDDKQNVTGWNTDKAIQVSYFGAGVGGTIIGFGATLVAITDDLFRSFEDAMSDIVLEKTLSWYHGTHTSRVEKGCPRIDIGTRWTKKDVIGMNMDSKFYDQSIMIPALDEDGQSFCEDVKTTDEYLDIRDRTPKEIWMAEFQQEPIESSGALFSRDDLKRYSLKDLKKRMESITPDAVLGYIDVADEGMDRLAMAIGTIIGSDVFITDVVFTRENIDVSLPLCIGAINRTNADHVRVESNNQGSVMIKMMRQFVAPEKVLKVTNTTNKHTRILLQYGFIKQNIHFIQDDEIDKGGEYWQFINEVLEYSKTGATKHDDAPDCLSGLAKFIQSFLPHLFIPQKSVA